ncbi:putative ATP-dependent DNA helicase RecS isoform X1 [Branchiostoma floridae x Branchiostoma japonicum]
MADVGKDVDVAISKALLSIESVDSLKPEQHQVLENFLCGRDVVGLLPTGFGKSLIYQLAPTVAKNLRSSALCPEHIKTAEFPSLIILSPLLALINDQVLEAREFGLSAMSLCDPSPTEEAQILSGKVRLMFANPETLVLDEKWRDMLLTERFQNNVVGLVVDEVHKTPSWGEAKKGGKAFRETFARIAELRSLCKHGTPVLALTASADTATRKDIVRLLNLSKHTVFVERSPNRTNIRLSAVRIKPSDDFACLDWLVTGVKKYGSEFGKAVIYCRDFKTVGAVYCHLVASLRDEAYVGVRISRNCRVGMYHSETLPEKKEHVLSSFRGTSKFSNLSVVIATTALSMGVNFPDVRYVVMYGPPDNMEDLMQQIGRAGRDNLPAHGIMYSYAQQRCDDNVRQYAKGTSCLRATLYNHFESAKSTVPLEPGHDCCTVCHKTCNCNTSSESCDVPSPVHEMSVAATETIPSKVRSVTDEQRELLTEGLYQYRYSLVKNKRLLLSVGHTTGFTDAFIESIVEKSPFIFSAKYILDNFPEIYSEQHAHSIMYIVNKVFNDNLDIDDLLEAIEADFESEIAQDPSIPDIPVTWSNSDSDNACAEEPISWDEFLYYDSD